MYSHRNGPHGSPPAVAGRSWAWEASVPPESRQRAPWRAPAPGIGLCCGPAGVRRISPCRTTTTSLPSPRGAGAGLQHRGTPLRPARSGRSGRSPTPRWPGCSARSGQATETARYGGGPAAGAGSGSGQRARVIGTAAGVGRRSGSTDLPPLGAVPGGISPRAPRRRKISRPAPGRRPPLRSAPPLARLPGLLVVPGLVLAFRYLAPVSAAVGPARRGAVAATLGLADFANRRVKAASMARHCQVFSATFPV